MLCRVAGNWAPAKERQDIALRRRDDAGDALRTSAEHVAFEEMVLAGVPSLVISYVYTPLGLPAPNYKLTHRPRDDSEA
jgi:hypothetical protein